MNKNAKKLSMLLNDKEAANNMRELIPIAFPDLSDNTSKAIVKVFADKKNIKPLIDSQAELFSKHFNDKEMKDLIKFFSSKTGKKWRHKMITIFEELSKLGKQWGELVVKNNEDTFNKILSADINLNPPQKEVKTTPMEKPFGDFDSLMDERLKFATQYAISKGWDYNNLTLEQVLEIRAQKEWRKNENTGKIGFK